MNVLMPQLGETVSEGKVIKWFKSVGDAVAVGENLCEIETDKVTVEVPAIEPGILQAINLEVGAVAPVGAVIAVLGGSAASARAPTSRASPVVTILPAGMLSAPPISPVMNGPASEPVERTLDPFREVDTPRQNFGPARIANGVFVTPLARRLAANSGIDLLQVAGSGPRGRIVAKDVEKAVALRPAPKPPLVRAEAVGEPISEVYWSRPHQVVPLDGMRRTIARRLVEAKTTIPHFYLAADIDIDRLLRLREEINAATVKSLDGEPVYKLSLNDFMIKALALALQQVPQANAIWSGDNIVRFEHSDIGVAVAVPGGLLTPVVPAAELKSLSAISKEMKGLAARARDRALQPHEYRGGSTTISNLGMHGVREFFSIINPPQATILAVGAAHRVAVETANGGVAFVSRIAITLSCDHRVVDGVLGAKLLESFRANIENPISLMV
jgi:pyruvate dehydrogenase E2 component (dihydrolipoamide acetyltransferase)